MVRPDYTARPREALLIVRSADGMLEIGKGRVRIAPGATPYFRRVTMALAHVLDLPGGPEAFERGDALGRPVTIMPPPVPTVPPNAWTLPDQSGDAACGSTIVFDPDDWPRGGDPASPSSHEVLLTLLEQANAYADGSYRPPAGPPGIGARQGQLQLSCHPAKVGNVLEFPYVIANPGPSDVFVMDAVASLDRETGLACAVERRSVLIGANGDAVVGTFIPPMPTDRQIATPVIPLSRRLPAGAELEHRLEIPAPYAETSPWLPDLPPQEHTATDIRGVVLAVHYWPAGPESVATEAPYAPGFYAMSVDGGSLVSLRFPTNGLRFLRRTDGFPRWSG